MHCPRLDERNLDTSAAVCFGSARVFRKNFTGKIRRVLINIIVLDLRSVYTVYCNSYEKYRRVFVLLSTAAVRPTDRPTDPPWNR